MEVRDRDLGRGRQVPVRPLEPEEVLLELRELSGPEERGRVDEERRQDLRVAVLPRVEVEHELDERARSGAAAGPRRTVKRAPVIFAARSKSRMPSAGPRSQCAFGAKSKRVGSPQVFRTTFAVSSAPSGTESSGMFGSVASMGANRSSRSFDLFFDEDDLRRERLARSAPRRPRPRPPCASRRSSAEREFRSARAASIRVICVRRSASMARHSSSAPSGTLRCRNRCGRRSNSFRRKSREIMEQRILSGAGAAYPARPLRGYASLLRA